MFSKSTSVVNVAVLNKILDDIITPELFQFGLQKRIGYYWLGEPENGIRKVFKWIRLKGSRETFAWGVCLDFIPTIKSGKLINHKTQKSVVLHLSNFTNGYKESFLENKLTEVASTLYGEVKAQKAIKEIFGRYRNEISEFYEKSKSFEFLGEVAKLHSLSDGIYQVLSPEPQYVYAFILAKLKLFDQAVNQLEKAAIADLDKHKGLKKKVLELLQKTAEG